MQKTFFYGVGGVLSADIAVPEHERELAFYASVLTTGDSPLWRDDLMNNLGTPVIGLGARTPEYDSLPLQWMPHFQVADIGDSVASAVKMGGKELMHSPGEWAVLLDPAGAAFGIIPVVPDESESAKPPQRFGCISWLSLNVPDAAPISDFYRRVIGWNAKSIEKENGDERSATFEMQADNGIAAAEICSLGTDSDSGVVPSVWLIHIPVGDFAESLRRVGEGGGKVIKEYPEANFAVIRDPVGAHFALRSG